VQLREAMTLAELQSFRSLREKVDESVAVSQPALMKPEMHADIRIGDSSRWIEVLDGAPFLLEEAKAAGVSPAPKKKVATPACDHMKAIGQWNVAWDPFYELDPEWTEAFMATGVGIYAAGVLSPKDVELLSIAFDASFTHMYAPGTRRHIHNALKAGATTEEIMEVLKLCVAQGCRPAISAFRFSPRTSRRR